MSDQTKKQRVFRLTPIVQYVDAPPWRLSFLPPTVLWVNAKSAAEARRLVAVTTVHDPTDRDALISSPWMSETWVECVEDSLARHPSRAFVQLASGTEIAISGSRKNRSERCAD